MDFALDNANTILTRDPDLGLDVLTVCKQSWRVTFCSDLSELIDGADSSNTMKQIQYAVKRLEAYAVFTGTSLAAVESLTEEAFDRLLLDSSLG